jgi:hypothetical protein
MRRRGSGVLISAADVEDFCRCWPASGLEDCPTPIFAGFDGTNLVELEGPRGRDLEAWDGLALSALVEDASEWLARTEGGGR